MNQLLNLKNIVAAGTIVGLVALGGVQYSQVRALRERIVALEKQEAWFEKETRSQIAMLATQPPPAPVPQETFEHIEKLMNAQAQASADRDALIRKLQQTQQKQQEIRAEINRVRVDASNTNQQIVAVSSEVGNVKNELASRGSMMDKSLSEMKRVVGDLGVQSQRIATNRKELDTLRATGDRNYFDFDLREKAVKRVSDVSITLKKTDPRRSRFTIEVLSNDKRVEKRDRAINEPIQFYVPKPHPPYDKIENELYEIVINEVKKDQIIGYLTTPRTLSASTPIAR
jgi:chromosome segregation ATPase